MNLAQLKEYRACLALRHCLHIGPRTWKRLCDFYGSAAEAVEDYASWREHRLVSARQYDSFVSKTWEQGQEEEHAAARIHRQCVVLSTDPRFPEALRQLPDPPLFLYYSGQISLLRNPCVAVVGSRMCSTAGVNMARRICRELSAAGITVVSGMARGIDRQAHLASVEGPGATIGVLATGLDQTFPLENSDVRRRIESRGLLLSEFAPGTEALPGNFHIRNRLVSGLSLGVVVVEAAKRSGTQITARLALDQGREVYALHGPEGTASFEGCRQLLEDGAHEIHSASEIILDLSAQIKACLEGKSPFAGRKPVMSPHQSKTPHMDMAPRGDVESAKTQASETALASSCLAGLEEDSDEFAVASLLSARTQTHIDALSRDLGWEASRTSSALLMLELDGRVHQLPGMEYVLSA